MTHEKIDQNFKPQLVRCKQWRLFSKKDRDIYCIGNEEKGDYVIVPSDQLQTIKRIIEYFDGEHSIKRIHEHVSKTMDLDAPIGEIFRVFRDANLIENCPKENPDEFQIASTTLASKNLASFFEAQPRLSGKVFYPVFFFSVSWLVLGLGIFVTSYGRVFSFSDIFIIEESTAIGIMISFVTIYVSSLIHEIGHIITAWYFGAPPKQIRVLLYLGLFPMLFVEIPNIYTLNRKQRILIALAGIYTNLMIASIAVLLLFVFVFPPSSRHLLIQIMFLNIITPLFILNPFLPGDGYFLLVNIFKTPNIRKDAFGKLRRIHKTKWSKKDVILVAYGATSLLVSAYFFYWFLEWFVSALIETLYTLHTLSSLVDYLLFGVKVTFFGLMMYSSVKVIALIIGRMKKT